MNNVACKLLAEDCKVYLNNLEGAGLSKYLRKELHHPFDVLMFPSLKFGMHGKLGAQFSINVDELVTTARQYLYDDESWLSEVTRVATTFNMALSYYYAF